MFGGKGVCNFSNFTLILINYHLNGLSILDEKTQTSSGDFAYLTNYILGTRRCFLRATDLIGEESYNGTHLVTSGAIKLLHEKKADMLMHITSFYKPISQVFDFTFPVVFEQQVIAHTLLNDLGAVQNSNSTLFSMITLDIRYIIVYVAVAWCIHLSFLILLRRRIYSKFIQAIVKFRFLKLHSVTGYFFRKRFGPDVSRVLIFNSFLLLTACFISTNMTHMFLADSIKTGKVVVDTSSILQSPSQALKSSRVWCRFPIDEVAALYQTAPENSVQNQIYRKKYKKDCVLYQGYLQDRNNPSIQLFKQEGFLIVTSTFGHVLVNLMSAGSENYRYWISGGFDGMNLGHLMRKSLPEKSKRFLVSYMLRYLEFGIHEYIYRSGREQTQLRSKEFANKVYTSIESIVNENTIFISDDYKTYKSTIFMLVAVQLVILLAFLCCHASKKLRIRSKIKYYWKVIRIRMEYRRTLRLLRARRMARNAKRGLETFDRVPRWYSR